jgi:hypothetical protein
MLTVQPKISSPSFELGKLSPRRRCEAADPVPDARIQHCGHVPGPGHAPLGHGSAYNLTGVQAAGLGVLQGPPQPRRRPGVQIPWLIPQRICHGLAVADDPGITCFRIPHHSEPGQVIGVRALVVPDLQGGLLAVVTFQDISDDRPRVPRLDVAKGDLAEVAAVAQDSEDDFAAPAFPGAGT